MVRGTFSGNITSLTLRTKMLILSVAAFTGIFLVGAIGLITINEVKVGGKAYKIIEKNRSSLESIALLKAEFYHINSELQGLVIETDLAGIANDSATIKKLVRDLDVRLENLAPPLDQPGKQSPLSKTATTWQEYRKTVLEEFLPAMSRRDLLTSSRLLTGIQAERFAALNNAAAQLAENIQRRVTASELEIAATIRIKVAICLLVTLVVITLITLISYFITVSTTRPLKDCVDFARALADGCLDTRMEIRGGGEAAALTMAMNSMAGNLHGMLSRLGATSQALTTIDSNLENAAHQAVNSARLQETAVSETSSAVQQINRSIQEVFTGIDKLSDSAAETSSSSLEMAATIEEIAINAEKLGETVEAVSSSIIQMATSIKEIDANIVHLQDASTMTASSIAQMDATIRQVEKNAIVSTSISETVRSDAEVGKNAVLEAIAGMQAIRASSRITSEVIETLSVRVRDIGAILSVIDEVADQTNLLALNAAIIAAQAGEQGKGFAVVADEIRELAERTSSSTREIAAVIRGVQEETGRAVDAISQAEESIAAGEELSQRSGAALEKIVAGVERAGTQVSEIAAATVEQARGSQSIREAMESIEDMVTSISDSACEHSRNTDTITEAAERMKELTVHVRNSIREQSRASSLIARSTEDATAMIDHIRESCRSQVGGSALIAKSVQSIEGATGATGQAISVMKDAVTGLTRQIHLLEKGMSGFKI